VVAGVAAAGLVLAGPSLAALARSPRGSLGRRGRLALSAAPLGLALVAGLAGPTAYALDTVGSAHTGAIPSAGPGGFAGPGGGPGGQGDGRFRAQGGSVPTPGGGFGGPRGGFGGGLDGRTAVSSALVTLLEQGASRYKWVAATEGSEGAAPLELATR
jgi:hypothetical protein